MQKNKSPRRIFITGLFLALSVVLLLLLTSCEKKEDEKDTPSNNATLPDGENDSEGCFCTAEYDPVCGKDGRTYSNACQAGCANVEILYLRECLDSSN